MGWVGILGGARGLLRATLPSRSEEVALFQFGGEVGSAVRSPGFFTDLGERLGAYFDGKKVSFPDELDPGVGTDFQRSVWRITRLIPYGETRSYRWVAEGLGDWRLARASGQALGRNPLAIIIPCHRVVGSDGGLCGFGGGLPMKEALLKLERAKLA
ncbi:MAG: methylated-DNA--[protein]-cysteine S-methyltransferase [Chloroflexota bacterium]